MAFAPPQRPGSTTPAPRTVTKVAAPTAAPRPGGVFSAPTAPTAPTSAPRPVSASPTAPAPFGIGGVTIQNKPGSAPSVTIGGKQYGITSDGKSFTYNGQAVPGSQSVPAGIMGGGLGGAFVDVGNGIADGAEFVAEHPVDALELAGGTVLVATGVGTAVGAGLIVKGIIDTTNDIIKTVNSDDSTSTLANPAAAGNAAQASGNASLSAIARALPVSDWTRTFLK
jgi:hypothetical protein